MGEVNGEDGLGSQSYVPFSLPKDPDAADEATKYVFHHRNVLKHGCFQPSHIISECHFPFQDLSDFKILPTLM